MKIFQNRVFKNASWIIGCKIVQSVLGLVISMLTARYLGPSNFGLINYAASLVTFVTPIMMLGFDAILVQEIVLRPESEGETLGTAIFLNLISSVFSIMGVISFVYVANYGEKETLVVCALYSLLLAARAFEMLYYWFQAKLLSKYTSIVSLVAYTLVALYKIFLLVTQKSIYWFAISNVLDYLIIAIGLFGVYKKLGNQKLSISITAGKKMFQKSKYYIVSSMMVTIFAQTDRIMLKLMIDDAATGYYSAAVACAGMTSFIFAAIIDSARPSIFEAQKCDKKKFEANISRLYSIIIYFALLQSLFIALFSKIIIYILYGESYEAAVSALRIIVWYTTFSYLGSVRNIWILAENKQQYLWIVNLSGAVMNICLNVLLIPMLGIIGASVASLFTQIFTNVIVGYIIKPLRYNNKLMMRGMNPKWIVKLLK